MYIFPLMRLIETQIYNKKARKKREKNKKINLFSSIIIDFQH